MTTKTTHIATVKAQYAYNRKQVLWLTGMTDEELNAFQFETGLAWLQQYTNDDRAVLDTLLREPMIWKWWLNEWNRRDDQINLHTMYQMRADWRLAQYRGLHQNVFLTTHPPYSLLEESYNQALRDWLKQGQQKGGGI